MHSKSTNFGHKNAFFSDKSSSDQEQCAYTQTSCIERPYYSATDGIKISQQKLQEVRSKRIKNSRSLSRETPKFPHKRSKTQQSLSLQVKKKASKSIIKLISPFSKKAKAINHRRTKCSIVRQAY
ncbi:unnamed protein product [Moneuplotes crassus]|uniref:Uncharacterized protein n=1 Tax=Euplotes crassus TaxID=5936 RepID=A0AAD2DBI8_EUPCR|nr:unnamed protein product [Moneuplotes crassus]